MAQINNIRTPFREPHRLNRNLSQTHILKPAIHQEVTDSVQEDWVARYNGPGNEDDYAEAIKTDDSGNIYVTGYCEGFNTGEDYTTIKYNSDGAEEWVARYNGPVNGDDAGRAISVDSYGNVYVTGGSFGSSSGQDYATIKYNSSGTEEWIARYNGPANLRDFAEAIASDDSGNVYVTGGSFSSATSYDFATIKYSSSGEEKWVIRNNGWGNSIKVDNSGDIFVTGESGQGDYKTIKYNSSGVEEWVALYNGRGGSIGAVGITIDASGNSYVTGANDDGSGSYTDYATVKYNPTGVEKWVARYNGSGNNDDEPTDIAVDNSGNVYVTGYSWGANSKYDYTTIEYDSSGSEKWVSIYDDPPYGYDWANALAVDNIGNVIVTGMSGDAANGVLDYATVQYNQSGTEEWVARYNGPGNSYDRAIAIAIDNSGNVYITGASTGSGTGFDYATIKYEPIATPVELTAFTTTTDGNNVSLNWSTATEKNNQGFEVERGTVNSEFAAIGFVKGGGTTTEEQYYSFTDKDLSSGEYQYRLKQADFNGSFKYSNTVNVKILSPAEFSLSQNYPNPFNPATQIKYTIPKDGFVSLKVYNTLGQQVASLENGFVKTGEHEVTLDGSKLSSGVYYYRIESGDNILVKKMILMK